MKVDVSMTTDKDLFEVSHWWAKEPAFVVDSLRRQLEAASAIWPELRQFAIVEKRSASKAQSAGGHARAASMTPEARSETARKAATARWSGAANDPVGTGVSGAAKTIMAE